MQVIRDAEFLVAGAQRLIFGSRGARSRWMTQLTRNVMSY
jgi:hypothetical protein